MNTGNQNRKHWVKSIHVLSACIWTGSCLSWIIILLSRAGTGSPEGLQAKFDLLFILCAYLIIPAAFGSLLTGFFICRTTSWGFLRYRWIVIKWIGTITGILIGSALLGPWLLQLRDMYSVQFASLPQSPQTLQLLRLSMVVGSAQTLGLVLLCLLSVFKPWGKREKLGRSLPVKHSDSGNRTIDSEDMQVVRREKELKGLFQ